MSLAALSPPAAKRARERAARSAAPSGSSRAGVTEHASIRSVDRCPSGSNFLMEAIVPPSSSTRTGASRAGGKRSTTPPRRENSPGALTMSTLSYPESMNQPGSSASSHSDPTRSAKHREANAAGGASGVKSASTGATSTAHAPDFSAARLLTRALTRERCGAIP